MLFRLRQRDLRDALAFWHELSAAASHVVEAEGVGEAAYRDKRLRGAFTNWRRLRVPLQQLEWAMRHIHYRRKRNAHRQWLMVTAEGIRTERLDRLGETRLESRTLHGALESWKSAAEWLRKVDDAVVACILRALAHAFACIEDAVRGRVERRGRSNLSASHFYVRSLKPAFHTWLKQYRERVWMSNCVPRAAILMLHTRSLASSVHKWRLFASEERHLGAKTIRLSAKRIRQMWRYGFYEWEAVVQPRTLEAKLRRIQRAGRVLVNAPSFEDSAREHRLENERLL